MIYVERQIIFIINDNFMFRSTPTPLSTQNISDNLSNIVIQICMFFIIILAPNKLH